jgi:hypothetical protein
MREFYTSNFRHGAIKATLEDFHNLAEKPDIGYKDTADVGCSFMMHIQKTSARRWNIVDRYACQNSNFTR